MTPMTLYNDKRRAARATALRSLNAAKRGKCSQYELRQGIGEWVGGLQHDLASNYGHWQIVAQWSAGYRVDGRVL